MYQKILEDIKNNHLFENQKKVLVAVSGGLDSMNLLQFLYNYQDILKIEIGIAHVNHKQRKESDEEEKYLMEWAAKQGIPIYISHFTGVFSEGKARNFRYDFFKKIMSLQSYDALVTAHHRDDQVETIFMRIIRGSLLRHLHGIKRVLPFGDGVIIRPFLPFSKKDLPDVFHFEDISNQELFYLRNRIRNTYIPLLRNENLNIDHHILHLSYESEVYLQAFKDLTSSVDINSTLYFDSQTPAVQYLLLQEYISKISELNISKKQFQELLQLLQEKETFEYNLKKDYILVKNKQKIVIQKFRPKTDSDLEEKVIKCGKTIQIGTTQFSFLKTKLELDYIPLLSTNPILLRGRKPGDKIKLGTFSKKVRRLFIDDKISKEERESALIGEQDGKIIFVQTQNKTYLRKHTESDTIKARLYIER